MKEKLPPDWRFLYPQCEKELGALLDGKVTTSARKQGYTDTFLQKTFNEIRNPNISPAQFLINYKKWLKQNVLATNATVKDADRENTQNGNIPKIYLGITYLNSLKWVDVPEKGMFVKCIFTQVGGDPFLEALRVGRGGDNETIWFEMTLAKRIELVPENSSGLHVCPMDRLQSVKVPPCDLLRMRTYFKQDVKSELIYTSALENMSSGNLNQSKADFDSFLDIFPQSYHGIFRRSQIEAMSGNSKKAVQLLDEAIKINPNAFYLHYERGRYLRSLGRLQEAIDSYNIAIDIQPDEAELYHQRGILHITLRQFKSALPDVNKAIAFSPKNAEYLHARSGVLLALNDVKGAFSDLKKVVNLDPTIEHARFVYGALLANQGDIDNAFEELDAAIRLSDKNPHSFKVRAQLYTKQGNFQKAYADISKALQLKPNLKDGKKLQKMLIAQLQKIKGK